MIWLALSLLAAAWWLLHLLGARLDAWETRRARIMAARSRSRVRSLTPDALRSVLAAGGNGSPGELGTSFSGEPVAHPPPSAPGAWGMGQRPMFPSGRATYPQPGAQRPPARPQPPCLPAPMAPCGVATLEPARGKPRRAGQAIPRPNPRLINRLFAPQGASRPVPRARCDEFLGSSGTGLSKEPARRPYLSAS